MRHFLSATLGIITSLLLVWLMTSLIQTSPAPAPKPTPEIDVIYTTMLDTTQAIKEPQPESKPPEPVDPPSQAIEIDAVGVDHSDHRVTISTRMDPTKTDFPVIRTTTGLPSLPIPSGTGTPVDIQLDYKHPVDYPRDARLEGLEGYVLIENVVDDADAYDECPAGECGALLRPEGEEREDADHESEAGESSIDELLHFSFSSR